MESDDEIGRVPETGREAGGTSASGLDANSGAGLDRVQVQGKRGRTPADRENKLAVEEVKPRPDFYYCPILVSIWITNKKNPYLHLNCHTPFSHY